jgi:glycosyltransferase involved in cell wall biosynthesis
MKSDTTVRLAIFNENFWNKGLIYSQNILPLKNIMMHQKDFYLELVTFVSFLDIIRFRKLIWSFKNEQKKNNVTVRIFPTLYVPSRLFYPRWFLFPFLFLNLFFYIIYLRMKDKFIDGKLYYNLRSYEIALAFNLFYGNKQRLIFDPRTDMLKELTHIGVWGENSISNKIWHYFEKIIVGNSHKSLFISDAMKNDILERCKLIDDKNKYIIYYNQVDFSHFKRSVVSNNNFLYTGSLNKWNNIRTYLLFFKKASCLINDTTLYIVTSTKPSKYEQILNEPEFDSIRDRIVVYNNPSYHKLPEIYSNCNYGLQLFNFPDSRLGVKFVEYIAAGLIPIVNENVKGAAAFVKTHSIGFILDNHFNNLDQFFCDKLIKERKTNQYASFKIEQLLNSNESYKTLYKVFS